MFQVFKHPAINEELTVCGVPFGICRQDGVVRKVKGNYLPVDGCYETLYFLGMSTEISSSVRSSKIRRIRPTRSPKKRRMEASYCTSVWPHHSEHCQLSVDIPRKYRVS